MTTVHPPAPLDSRGMRSILLSHNRYRKSVGAVLRDHRVRSGLTQGMLADRASVARSTVEKLESDWRRATPGIIWPLCEVLGVSVPARRRLVERAAEDSLYRSTPIDPNRLPTRRDLSVLDTPHPAALLLSDAFLILGANPAFTATHRGLDAGDFYVDWLLCDPRARDLLPAPEWHRHTHAVLREYRERILESLPDKAIRDIEARLSIAPEFDRMWNGPAPEALADCERLRMRHPDGAVRDVYTNTLRAPGMPWHINTLVPA